MNKAQCGLPVLSIILLGHIINLFPIIQITVFSHYRVAGVQLECGIKLSLELNLLLYNVT